MRVSALAILLPLAGAIAGCRDSREAIANGDDPLRALTVPHKSERYTSTYWTQKSIRDKALYSQAVDYCKDKNDGEHPNCDVVRYVDMLERSSRLPENRPNDFSPVKMLERDTAR
jgi:hypothetical protein